MSLTLVMMSSGEALSISSGKGSSSGTCGLASSILTSSPVAVDDPAAAACSGLGCSPEGLGGGGGAEESISVVPCSKAETRRIGQIQALPSDPLKDARTELSLNHSAKSVPRIKLCSLVHLLTSCRSTADLCTSQSQPFRAFLAPQSGLTGRQLACSLPLCCKSSSDSRVLLTVSFLGFRAWPTPFLRPM